MNFKNNRNYLPNKHSTYIFQKNIPNKVCRRNLPTTTITVGAGVTFVIPVFVAILFGVGYYCTMVPVGGGGSSSSVPTGVPILEPHMEIIQELASRIKEGDYDLVNHPDIAQELFQTALSKLRVLEILCIENNVNNNVQDHIRRAISALLDLYPRYDLFQGFSEIQKDAAKLIVSRLETVTYVYHYVYFELSTT